MIAGAQRITALDPSTGSEHWHFSQLGTAQGRRAPDPFAHPEPAAAPEAARGLLHGFQLVGTRLFCLRGESELIAIDGDTGSVDWSYATKEASVNPKLWIGSDRVVLQVQRPNQILVLETQSGRPMARLTLADGESLERPPVPLDEDHVILVPDRRTVKKLDVSRGQWVWDYRESAELPVTGPPRVIVDGERLLVLHDGRLLIRLDPVSGSRKWSALLGLEDLSDRPDAIACDARRVYCVSQQNVRALSIEDGKSVWSAHLAGPENALWSLALSARYVLAYPSLSNASGDEIEVMPVVVRRQETGSLVQRLVFPASIADVNLRLDARGAVVATAQGLWSLASREATTSPSPPP